jgi:hypothetical protein
MPGYGFLADYNLSEITPLLTTSIFIVRGEDQPFSRTYGVIWSSRIKLFSIIFSIKIVRKCPKFVQGDFFFFFFFGIPLRFISLFRNHMYILVMGSNHMKYELM